MTKTILLVDDHLESVAPLRMFLMEHGYEITFASSGAKAEAMLQADPLPHLIVLDYMMPGMNGLEFLRDMRSDPRTRQIPVVMYSAVGQSTYLAGAVASGASRFWVKAKTEFPEMLEDVERLLNSTTAALPPALLGDEPPPRPDCDPNPDCDSGG